MQNVFFLKKKSVIVHDVRLTIYQKLTKGKIREVPEFWDDAKGEGVASLRLKFCFLFFLLTTIHAAKITRVSTKTPTTLLIANAPPAP